MAAQQQSRSCFGMFMGKGECSSCPAHRHCKTILLSHGFDNVAAMVDQLAATLEVGEYPDGLDVEDKTDAERLIQILIAGNATPNAA